MVKKRKLAINVDEYGRNKKYLSRLLDLLSDEYPVLKQANRFASTKRVAAAKKGDVIVFGFSKAFDFKVITEDQYEEYSVHRRTPEFDLSSDWYEIVEAIEEYAVANYPDEFEEENNCTCHKYCRTSDVLYVDNDRDWEDLFVAVPSKRKVKQQRPVRKNKKALGLEDVEVKHNYVRVGWDVFDIWFNSDDEEYVTVDNNVYWVDRDSSGRGKLSVK
jgi:hypothetical protein